MKKYILGLLIFTSLFMLTGCEDTPTITLNGEANMNLFVGDEYVEQGATAVDKLGENLEVTIDGTVDTSKIGTYNITYSAIDKKGNKANETRTVTVQEATLTSLTIDTNTTALNVGDAISVVVMGTYSDSTIKELDANITWVISPADSLEVNGTSFIALKDGNVTVQAKVNDVLSNILTLNVAWIINGYTLPPQPDETINNSTLLGIDSNDNGVRDDVEIYIVKRYSEEQKYPKTKTAIALQHAWASQKILESPTMESKKYIDDALDCEFYWLKQETKEMSGFEGLQYHNKHEVFNNPEVKDKIYNTRERIEEKFRFNSALSGNIFSGRNQSIENCRTNIDEIGE
jgi:hypothetical protein